MTNSVDDHGLNEVVKAVLDYYECFSSLEVFCSAFHIRLEASCIINFRDALFHFKKLYDGHSENPNGRTFEIEKRSLMEHLQRGIKDILVYTSLVLSWRCADILSKDSLRNKSKHETIDFKSALYKFDNIRLNLRSDFFEWNIDVILDYIRQIKDNVELAQTTLKTWNLDKLLIRRTKIEE